MGVRPHQNEAIVSLPVTVIRGVGEQVASKLSRLGIHTVQDLLFHLPMRYQDRTQVTALGALRVGMEVLVMGRVELTEIVYGRRRSLLSRISDGTGALTIRLFHFSTRQQANLKRGRWVWCFGQVRRGPGTLEIVHPEYRVSDEQPRIAEADGLTPIYPTTEGVGQATIRRIIQHALVGYLARVGELLPESVLERLGYPTLQEALAYVHRPPVSVDLERLRTGLDPSQQRLAFEELLAHHLSLRLIRRRRQTERAPRLRARRGIVNEFWGQLEFTPTGAQLRVSEEILRHLERAEPMLRLMQGDVGSGKTVVAAAVAVHAAESGFQTAVMAPTELLAEQHFRNFHKWLEPLDLGVGWMSGRTTAGERRTLQKRLTQGDLMIIVGTHALFQSDLVFDRLGLIIVDEQHRFGVDQRLALRDKGKRRAHTPHQLIMTATPIPRTLAMTFYADLDVSSLDELPPGRQPVETVVVPDSRRKDVVQRVHHACRRGSQAYWVCPLIDESETLEVQAATDTEIQLSNALPELNIGMVHGRMRARDKDVVMERFRIGEIDLLVATTVIEVGVDVPNASLMIIENAERLGLAQLHQLRGRVGRGNQQACCVLMYRPPLSQHARIRLSTLRGTTDGFDIAQQDLELRGPGELLGTRQTGLQDLRVADLARDRSLLPRIEEIGRLLLQNYPERATAVVQRWVGRAQEYGSV